RDDLLVELGLPPAVTDSAIVAAAWDRWGDESPTRLYGDWAFAVWDARARRLFLARDQYGHTALYYHHSPTRLAFATGLKALFALPEIPRRLDELRFVQSLILWITDGARTMYEGVLRLPPGHSLVADARGCATRCYWHPENASEVR